jgi:phosphate-selective porin OprO/OprP
MRHAGSAAVLALALALADPWPPSLAEEPDAAAAAPASSEDEGQVQPQGTTLTRGELQRRLDDARARLEDLLVTFEGEAQPTPAQVERFKELRREVAELEQQLAETAPLPPSPEDDSWKARWARYRKATQELTRYDLKDGMLRFRLGMRLQLDGTLVGESDQLDAEFGNLPNELKIRRARVFAEGRILRRWNFNFTYDFGSDPGVKNAYIEGIKFTKIGHWRLGIFQEPFSLEKYTPYNYIAPMESSLPVETFAPGSNFGAMFHRLGLEQRLSWSVAVMTNTTSGADNSSESNYNFTGRITGVPVYRNEGRQVVHLGLGYSARNTAQDEVRYKTRPEARFVTPLLDTGDIPANSISLTGFEFAAVHGPWWAQYEWITSRLDADSVDDPAFTGSYIEVGRFLTGETRPYEVRDGTFGRVVPFRSYKKKGNPFKKDSFGGALEVVGRLSTTDLSDQGVQAGQLNDLTLGMNWYLTPATAFLVNYIHSDLDPGGEAHILLIRYQFNP